MAAVTGVITAVAGLGLSVYGMYSQSEAQKDADKASEAAKKRLEQIEEQNVMEAVQTPDISSLAFERIAQAEAAGLETLKGMGVEGAAQVTGMVEQGRQAGLEVAEKQAILEAQTDFQKAQVAQQIEGRRVDREIAIASGELEGAQLASAEARAGKRAATMDVVAGIGNVVGEVGGATSLEAKAQRGARRGVEDITTTTETPTVSTGLGGTGDINKIYASGAYDPITGEELFPSQMMQLEERQKQLQQQYQKP